jgi:hypothetical protein
LIKNLRIELTVKLLQQYYSSRQAELDSLVLEQQGILVHVSSKNSHSLSGFVTGAFTVGLWAVFDHQYEDAKAYLADATHEVTSGFSVDELANVRTDSEHYSYAALNRFLIYTFGGIGSAIVLVATYIYW